MQAQARVIIQQRAVDLAKRRKLRAAVRREPEAGRGILWAQVLREWEMAMDAALPVQEQGNPGVEPAQDREQAAGRAADRSPASRFRAVKEMMARVRRTPSPLHRKLRIR